MENKGLPDAGEGAEDAHNSSMIKTLPPGIRGERKKMKEKILNFLKTAKELCEKEGGFEELPRRRKQEIFDQLIYAVGKDVGVDADTESAYAIADIKKMRISFSANCEYADLDDIRGSLEDMWITVDGYEATFDTAIKYAEDNFPGDEVKPLPLAILNTSILTAVGTYELKDIDVDTARMLVRTREIDSAVGHQSTAQIMSTLLEREIPFNRQMFSQQPGQQALVFKLNGRPQEGEILAVDEIEKIGYKFQILERLG